MDKFKVLKESFLLRNIPESALDDAISLLSPLEANFAKSAVLATVGERVQSLRFITKGHALVFRDPEHKTLLSRLDPGDCFGVANLFSDFPTQPTEIVADAQLSLIEVDEAPLIALFAQHPCSALNYISFLSDKIRFLNRRIADFSCGSAEKKVARLLLLSDGGASLLTLGNLRQTAESMGLGRASLYRVLSEFESRNLILKDGKQIAILDPNGLKGILS